MRKLSCWGGYANPHKLAEALSLVLQHLSPDSRASAACVSRAWRAATSHPLLWEELTFECCTARVDNATLASLCKRAGAMLRTLYLDANVCNRVTAAGMLAALRDGGCTGVRRLNAPLLQESPGAMDHFSCQQYRMLTAEEVQQLAATCSMLQHAACTVHCCLSDAAAASMALPGPLTMWCKGEFVEAEASTQLVESLRDNTTLTRLSLFKSCLGNADAMQLAECLRFNTTLKSLDFSYNGIDDAGATHLAQILQDNAALTSLGLHHNRISDLGAAQLAECLHVNTTLRSLDLGCNFIGIEGATQFADCLRVNTSLKSLFLGDCGIYDEGATQLAECLRVNATLTSLELWSNMIDDAGAAQLAESLCFNAALRSLRLDDNNIGNAGATQLAECLRVNNTLTRLDLGRCGIGADGATQLAECLRVNTALTTLDLRYNDIGDAGATQLAESVGRCVVTYDHESELVTRGPPAVACGCNSMRACCMSMESRGDRAEYSSMSSASVSPRALRRTSDGFLWGKRVVGRRRAARHNKMRAPTHPFRSSCTV